MYRLVHKLFFIKGRPDGPRFRGTRPFSSNRSGEVPMFRKLIVRFSGVAATLAALCSFQPASAACSLTPTNGTVTKLSWVSGQGLRSYNLRVPAGLTGPAPLLVVAHGLGS